MNGGVSSLRSLFFAILVLCTCTVARTQAISDFNLPVQPLADSLRAVASVANVNVLYDPPMVAGFQAPALSARMSAEEALTKLLAGTGLTHRFVNEHTVVLSVVKNSQPPSRSSSLSEGRTQAEVEDAGIRLAEAEVVGEVSAKEKQPGQSSPDEQGPTDNGSQLDEIVVTGTHIRGIRQIAAPSVTFTREDLAKTGYGDLGQLFEDLPQNFDAVTFDATLAERSLGGSGNRADRATGIDLRGLGPGSTLTLLNGTRRAASVNGTVVDISAIPLSVIERVEIVSGGRSAVYGSDAVGGVVNLVTRRKYSGLETQVQYGWAKDGAENLQASAMTGADFTRGGIVAAYDFQRNWPLDLIDTGHFFSPLPVTGVEIRGVDLRPAAKQHSAFLSGHYLASESVELRVDALYTTKGQESSIRQRFPGATAESTQFDDVSSDSYSASIGASVELGSAWVLDISATASEAQREFRGAQFFDLGFVAVNRLFVDDAENTLRGAAASVSGPLPAIGQVVPRAAFGVETRDEKLTRFNADAVSGFVINDFDRSRTVQSVFGELILPFGKDGMRSGLTQLELSLAGRYDDYDDVGGTFNPQADIIWKPLERLTVSAAYAEAFRAPVLLEVGGITNQLGIDNYIDSSAPGGVLPVLFWDGNSRRLAPEEARTFSAGIDWELDSVPGEQLSLSYFDIRYEGRIGTPAPFPDSLLVLERDEQYGGLIDRSPSAAEIEDLVSIDSDGVIDNFNGIVFDTSQPLLGLPDLVVFDNRTGNVAVEKIRGLDLNLNGQIEGHIGALSYGLNAVYTMDHDRSLVAGTPEFTLLNEVGRPVDLRARGNLGWERGSHGAFLYVNYVDSYTNPLVTPAARMASWTTLDLTLRFLGSKSSAAGWLDGVDATLSVDNLLDKDPPEMLPGFAGSGYGFDAVNANALGRYISARLVKKW